jgi:hypothetical protein
MQPANPMATMPYWKQPFENPKEFERILAHENAITERVAVALGSDARLSATLDPITRAHRFGKLPDEKIEALLRIEHDYQNLLNRNAVKINSRGDYDNAMSERAALEREMAADIAALLSPEEALELEKRNSLAAKLVASRIRNVDVTEEQFTALFNSQKAYFDAYPPNQPLADRASEYPRFQADVELQKQFRAILGDAGFHEYLQSGDSRFRAIAAFTSLHPEVSVESALRLHELQLEAQMMLTASPAAKDVVQRRALAEEYYARMEKILGVPLAAEFAKTGSIRKPPPPVPPVSPGR